MTHFDDDEPIDLRALGAHPNPEQADRVIGSAMGRIRSADRATATPTVLADVATWWYPGLVAAALVFAMATGVALVWSSRNASAVSVAGIEGQLLDWARDGHVPTNGDLLAAFGARQ
jgi:hypothetical protein